MHMKVFFACMLATMAAAVAVEKRQPSLAECLASCSGSVFQICLEQSVSPEETAECDGSRNFCENACREVCVDSNLSVDG
jgi:hypothetical protein